MKLEEKNKARELRYDGFSIAQIAEYLEVSKGSVSSWVRDIVMPETASLNIELRKEAAREKAKRTRFFNIVKANNEIIIKCGKEILPFSKRDLWIAGLMIYAGEGRKSRSVSSQHIEVTNSDPRIVRIFINFLIQVCAVPKEKIRVRLMLYSDINIKEARKYWSDELGIPLLQFQNEFIKESYKNISSRHLRRSKYGTAHINVYDIVLYKKILGWLEVIYDYNDLDFKKLRGVAQFG